MSSRSRISDGATRYKALVEARDLLRELIGDHDPGGRGPARAVSRAGRGRPLVVPPMQIALKAALYQAYRQAGISQRRLARDLDVAESEVRRRPQRSIVPCAGWGSG